MFFTWTNMESKFKVMASQFLSSFVYLGQMFACKRKWFQNTEGTFHEAFISLWESPVGLVGNRASAGR